MGGEGTRGLIFSRWEICIGYVLTGLGLGQDGGFDKAKPLFFVVIVLQGDYWEGDDSNLGRERRREVFVAKH